MGFQCRVACGACCLDWVTALPERSFLSRNPSWTKPCPYLTPRGCRFAWEMRPPICQNHHCTLSELAEKFKLEKTGVEKPLDPKSPLTAEQILCLQRKIAAGYEIDPNIATIIDSLRRKY